MFGDRMSYMSETYWLTVAERKSAKLQNEDDESDDEDIMNLQVKEERISTGERIQTFSLPGYRVRQLVAATELVPGLPNQNFHRIDKYFTPSRTIIPPAFSTPPTTFIEPGPSSSSLTSLESAQIASAALDRDRQLAVRLQKELDRQDEDIDVEGNRRHISGAGASDDDSFGGFEDDEEPQCTSPPNFGGSDTSDSSSSSSSSDTESDGGPRGEKLSNRPPGTSKDWGIDVTSLKARRRQAFYRAKVAARYDKGHNAQVFEPNIMVSVKIPPKDRATGVDN